MRIRSLLVLFAAGSWAVLGALVAPAQAAPEGFGIQAGPVSDVVSVSPDVFHDPASSTYYLYTTGMRIGVYSSTDGTTWAAVPSASTPTGPFSDPSVVAVGDGTYRMYLTERVSTGQPCAGTRMRYATSPDLLTWTLQPEVIFDDLGCGVPDVVRTPAGYLLSYVRGGAGLEHGIYQATSADGISWTAVAGIVAPADRVDPSVVYLGQDRWIMLTADFPSGKAAPGFRQALYVATSADGRTWDFADARALYEAPSPQGAFDPDAVLLPDGSVRVWWAQGNSTTAFVAPGTLTMPAPAPIVVEPGKPTVSKPGKRVTVAWTYSGDTSEITGFRVQMRGAGEWTTVGAEVLPDRTSVRLAKAQIPVKPGQRLQVRIVAFAVTDEAETTATSPVRTVKAWK